MSIHDEEFNFDTDEDRNEMIDFIADNPLVAEDENLENLWIRIGPKKIWVKNLRNDSRRMDVVQKYLQLIERHR